MARLIVIDGPDLGNEYDLERAGDDSTSQVLVGRDPRVAVSLNDNAVSREHCRLELSPAGCRLTDLGSRNRTYLNGDPIDCCVVAFLEDSIESPTRYIGDARKGDDLIARIAENQAEGVLFCAPSFCDPALLDQPMSVAAVERAGVPWTSFKYSENTGQFQVIREQAGTFADSIRLWSQD